MVVRIDYTDVCFVVLTLQIYNFFRNQRLFRQKTPKFVLVVPVVFKTTLILNKKHYS